MKYYTAIQSLEISCFSFVPSYKMFLKIIKLGYGPDIYKNIY